MEGEDGADPTLVDGICCKSVTLESETIWNIMELHHSWSQKQCELKVGRIWIFFAAVVMSSKKKLKFFAHDEQATLITTRRNPQPMR